MEKDTRARKDIRDMADMNMHSEGTREDREKKK